MYSEDIRHFLILAKEEGLVNGEYIFIGHEAYWGSAGSVRYLEPQLDDTEVYHGVVTLNEVYDLTTEDHFYQNMLWILGTNKTNKNNTDMFLDKQIKVAGKLYIAI